MDAVMIHSDESKNSVTNLMEQLDDDSIVDHMIHRRNQLLSTLPATLDTKKLETDIHRSISTIRTGLNTKTRELYMLQCSLSLQAKNANILATGGRPHGYVSTDSKDCYFKFAQYINSMDTELTDIITTLKQLEQSASSLQRDHDTLMSAHS
jgi:hypothetical protein